jgi:hypothetical protein
MKTASRERDDRPRQPSYAGLWTLLLAGSALAGLWAFEGNAFARRRFFGVPAVPEASRSESRFVALLFPRITSDGERFTLSARDFKSVLEGLQRSEHVSIGLRDVEDFYLRRRLLPPKAVLIGFDRDYPESIALADGVLKDLRMRGVLFLSQVAGDGGIEQRKFLSAHAVGQLLKGGAWDLGRVAGARGAPAAPGTFSVVLARGVSSAAPRPPAARELRFLASDAGCNDERDDLQRLNIMSVPTRHAPAELVRIIEGSWPRSSEFTDRFGSERLGSDWIVGWGNVSAHKGRLALLPLPTQRGAAVSLRGTEKWRDLEVEFELARTQREAWVFARYQDDGGYVRVGPRDGAWVVEQRIGAGRLPSLLGKAAMRENDLPARVRFVLKGEWAILFVNDRMQFGRALRIDPRVDRGRVQFEVYDRSPRAARAAWTSVRARPVGGDWVAWGAGEIGGRSEDDRLAGLRAQAAAAHALSPRWLSIGSDGSVSRAGDEEQRGFIKALAGFYRCRLVPMVDFSRPGTALLGDAHRALKLRKGLAEAAAALEVSGLNLNLHGWRADQAEAVRFLADLRAELHARRRGLWVTLDQAQAEVPALSRAVDGVLRPAAGAAPGLDLLRIADDRTVVRAWEGPTEIQ